ncbi:MAG: hypothetical protein V1645_00910 [archaeon]
MVQISDLVRKKLGDNDTFLVFTSARSPEYKTIGTDILKYIVSEMKSPVVYLCIDKPFSSIKRSLEKDKVDLKVVVFIDTITLMSGSEPKDSSCLYIRSPENLTDISIAISQAISSLAGSKAYIIIDSLSTLLIYNNMQTVIKFVHIMNAKIKEYGAKGLAISSRKGADDEFANQVFKFFDDSIDFSGGRSNGNL